MDEKARKPCVNFTKLKGDIDLVLRDVASLVQECPTRK